MCHPALQRGRNGSLEPGYSPVTPSALTPTGVSTLPCFLSLTTKSTQHPAALSGLCVAANQRGGIHTRMSSHLSHHRSCCLVTLSPSNCLCGTPPAATASAATARLLSASVVVTDGLRCGLSVTASSCCSCALSSEPCCAVLCCAGDLGLRLPGALRQ
jgi:hypothetical protein